MVLLFSSSALRDFILQRQQALHNEVYDTPDDHVLTADVDVWAAALGEAYAINAPAVRADEMYAEPPETGLVQDRHGRRVQGTVVHVHVPFSGDSNVFLLQPSTHTWNPPASAIRQDELVFELSWAHHQPLDPAAVVRQELERIERYLEWSRTDCQQHNNGLDGYAKAQIENRANAIRASRAVVEGSGIPIRSPAGKRNIADAIRRRPRPGPRDVAGRGPAVPLDPVLSDEEYEYILSVIRNQGDAMQRAPGGYAEMDEPALRQVLASGLSTHYVGAVAAEAFNGAGKTDLLVRVGERAVFIGECKIWAGAADLGRALEQLLGYATWSDSKLALVVFVRLANLADVVTKAEAALRDDTAVAEVRKHDDGGLRCRLVYGRERERRAELAVVFIHLPVVQGGRAGHLDGVRLSKRRES